MAGAPAQADSVQEAIQPEGLPPGRPPKRRVWFPSGILGGALSRQGSHPGLEKKDERGMRPEGGTGEGSEPERGI